MGEAKTRGSCRKHQVSQQDISRAKAEGDQNIGKRAKSSQIKEDLEDAVATDPCSRGVVD